MKHLFRLLAFTAVLGTLLTLAGCQSLDVAAPAQREPQLSALSARLSGILLDGDIPVLAIEPEKQAAMMHLEFGVAADYRAWITDIRDYSQAIEAFQEYRDLPVVKKLAGDPINVPWALDVWEQDLVHGAPGVDTSMREVATLMGEFPETDAKASMPKSMKLSSQPLARFADAAVRAAEIVDKEALGQVSPGERELLQFVIPWICRSGGTFFHKSKGSPFYSMEMMFAPNDAFGDGDVKTSSSQTPVPARLKSITGLARFLHTLAGQAVTDLMPFENEKGDQPTFACRVDFDAMRRALGSLCRVLNAKSLDALSFELLQHERNGDLSRAAVPGVSGTLIAVIETPAGKIIVGGSGPNRYEDVDALAILDLGGDDEYVFNHPEAQIGVRSVQIIIDFAGDDVYQTQGVGGPGAGLLGIGILIDRAGNDRYCQALSPLFMPRENPRGSIVRPDPEGVKTALVPFVLLYGNPALPEESGVKLDGGFAFGAGFLGIGVLVDEAGDDLYLGQKFAFGCGFWHGVGVLHDVSGNDVYAAGLASIGAGINGGFGLLDDRAGDDHYQCLGTFESAYSGGQKWDNGYMSSGIGFGSSWRAEKRAKNLRRTPTLGGGVGIVHDAGGDDMYVGSSFGVAAAYAGGVGAVIDDAGNDTYFVKRGPEGDNYSGWSGNHALGNGCHRGVGYLLDRAGDDRYSASGLGGGTAWDRASGFLLDLGGNDSMTDLHGKKLNGNTGWGAAKGFAVSFHVGGTDTYERGTFGDATAISDGYPGRGGNFSFFFDVGTESDQYPQENWNNAVRLGGVSWIKEADGKEYPQGIGLFFDGPDVLQSAKHK